MRAAPPFEPAGHGDLQPQPPRRRRRLPGVWTSAEGLGLLWRAIGASHSTCLRRRKVNSLVVVVVVGLKNKFGAYFACIFSSRRLSVLFLSNYKLQTRDAPFCFSFYISTKVKCCRVNYFIYNKIK